jgi:hypothetical protein
VDQPARDQEPASHAARESSHDRVRPGLEVGDREGPLHGGGTLGPRDAIQAGEDGEDLPAGELDIQVVKLGHDPHRHPRLLGLTWQLVAQHLDRPLVGERLRGQHPHRGRFSGSVRAEQAKADAGGNAQVKSGYGGYLAVALDHASELDCRPGTHPSEDRERGRASALGAIRLK